jgi:hypothetical protein
MTWEMEMKVKVLKHMQNSDSGIQWVSKVGFHNKRLGYVVRPLLLSLFRSLHFSSSTLFSSYFVPDLLSYMYSPPLFYCLLFVFNF